MPGSSELNVLVANRVAGTLGRAIADIRRYMRQHSDFTRAGEHLIATFRRGMARVEK